MCLNNAFYFLRLFLELGLTNHKLNVMCVRTSVKSELRTRAAALIKSPISMVKPGRPRKKNRGEQERMTVFKMSW